MAISQFIEICISVSMGNKPKRRVDVSEREMAYFSEVDKNTVA